MVNNVNGSNPNLYVDPRNNNNGQPKIVNPPRQQGGYNTDGYAINMSNTIATGPVPDVKVGFMDRMGLTFKDVMQTEDNTKRFVAFQNAMKSNPQGYLQPSSNDVTATTDLQKKLKIMGYNITVNGSFGNATEQAVIKFKNSVGVNDGYLTKNGNYAVSGIVTPQTWAVLNASVAARMNPNSNLSGGNYVPPVTQKELGWAKELQTKISQFGYRPSQEERTKYEDIYQRQRVGMQSQEGVFNPTKAAPPTEQEMAWAQDLANKMKQFGYKPNQTEKAKYQEIYQRIQMNKVDNANTAKLENPKPVTQAEVDWAVNLMNKVKNGYNPTGAESQKYEQIYSAIQQGKGPQKKNDVAPTQNNNTVAPNNNPPTQEELKWASDLESKVKNGYNPTAQEKDKYTGIFERYKASATKPSENTAPTQNTGKPSAEEIKWAQDLETKVNEQGYQPSQAEIDKYTDISNRLNANQTKPKKEVQEPQETSNTNFTVEQFGKIGNAYNNWKSKHPDTSFPRDNVFYPKSNGQLVSQAQVNKASKSGGDYVSKLGLKNAPALYIPDLNSSQISNYKFVNGSIVANSGNTSPKQTQKPVQKNEVEDNQDYSAPVNNTKPTSNIPKSNIQNGVSRQELEWADNLQQKVEQGYQPTEQELAAYTNIYERFQKGTAPQSTSNNNTTQTQDYGNQNVNIDVSNGDPELQWALNLLDKVQQGYNPTQDEMTKYEQVIAKNQSVQATP
jgi:hypothetical protein